MIERKKRKKEKTASHKTCFLKNTKIKLLFLVSVTVYMLRGILVIRDFAVLITFVFWS